MSYPVTHHARHERPSDVPPECVHKAHFSAHWRECAAVAGGILVFLITSWLIWAALAEAVLAAAETV